MKVVGAARSRRSRRRRRDRAAARSSRPATPSTVNSQIDTAGSARYARISSTVHGRRSTQWCSRPISRVEIPPERRRTIEHALDARRRHPAAAPARRLRAFAHLEIRPRADHWRPLMSVSAAPPARASSAPRTRTSVPSGSSDPGAPAFRLEQDVDRARRSPGRCCPGWSTRCRARCPRGLEASRVVSLQPAARRAPARPRRRARRRHASARWRRAAADD